MRHLDENTIAYYAMAWDFTGSEKEAIEAHLMECAGCRAQVDELRRINQSVAESLEFQESAEELPPDALGFTHKAVGRRPDASPVRLKMRELTRTARFAALVRRHPIRAGSAGMACAILAFLVVSNISQWGRKAEQPLFVRVNALCTALDVYGKDSKLFEIPVSPSSISKSDYERQQSLVTRIADIYGDGNLEVLTGSPMLVEGATVWNVLRIFSSKGELLSSWHLGTSVRYNGADYGGSYGISHITIRSRAESSEREILVGINNMRSPWCLVRLDARGKTLGEYWHFGWMWGATTIHVEGVDHDLVLLTGNNDVEYRANNNIPVLTVVDPAKITGSAESRCTRGFGLPASEAELCYVKSGNVNPALISGAKVECPTFGYAVKVGTDSSLVVTEGFSFPGDFPEISYTFDRNLKLQDVWMADLNRLTLMDKFLVKKTSEGFTEFLNDMRDKVRYWDGSRWEKQPAMIKHHSPPI